MLKEIRNIKKESSCLGNMKKIMVLILKQNLSKLLGTVKHAYNEVQGTGDFTLL